MNRLTEKDDQGNWALKGIHWQQLCTGRTITREVQEKLYGALHKLLDYEEVGLNPDEVESLKDKNKWIPVSKKLPESGEYILISFTNFDIPEIGRYEVDKEGSGAFYPGDDNTSYAQFDLYVNAWRPLPKAYEENGK